MRRPLLRRSLPLVLGLATALSLTAGCSEPPCDAAPLSAAWTSAPLAGLVPGDVHVCQTAAAEAPTHASYWVDVTVHRANMDAVDRAQSADWSRVRDNWYGSSGDFNTPKWSELSNDAGTLRIDVQESGGGALVELVFTPHGAS